MDTMNQLPAPVKQALWSYDTSRIDLNIHKKLIISQVLNYGVKEATDWLFRTYEIEEIRNISNTIPMGQWSKKSLGLWSLFLGINPRPRAERVLR